MDNINPTESYQLPDPELLGDNDLQNVFSALRVESGSMRLPILWSYENGIPFVKDLAEINNILVAGSQGQGKTGFLHQLIVSLLATQKPENVQLIIVDYKKREFQGYERPLQQFLAHAKKVSPSIVPNEEASVTAICDSLWVEIERRNELFRPVNARSIGEYHRAGKSLPYIVVFIDEMADIVKKEDRQAIERLLGRTHKMGIVYILSTGVHGGHHVSSRIQSGVEEKIVFRLFDRDDYRVFLDTTSVPMDQPKGQFLFRQYGRLVAGKTVMIDFLKLAALLDFVGKQPKNGSFLLPGSAFEESLEKADLGERDPLFEEAARLIVINQLGSTSLIQRKMKLGYNRAGRLMDQLEAVGVVSPHGKGGYRDVLIRSEAELDMYLDPDNYASPTVVSNRREPSAPPPSEKEAETLPDLPPEEKVRPNENKGCAFIVIFLFSVALGLLLELT
jgi:S-DNA-T family DNA segregation ATPase FtsK/SpoIIIE